MKRKPLKVIGIIAGIIIAGIVALLIYIKVALPDVGPAPDIKVVATPEMVSRGAYLANHVMVCMDCHGSRDWTKFSGPMKPGSEGAGGEVFDQRYGFPGSYIAKNITPFNLSNWTDGEIFRTITTGVNKDGKALFPVMPYKNYGQLDEEDIKAVIAYIRTLPSIENTVAASKPDFPLNFILNTIPKKASLQKRPPRTQLLAYGKYMATASGCIECHTKQVKGEVTGKPFAGGFEFNVGHGNVVRSMNITSDPSGIGNWTKDQFVQRFRMYADPSYILPGVDLAKGDLQSVMPWTMYAGMTTEDLGAIYEYLRTVPKVKNSVVRYSIAQK